MMTNPSRLRSTPRLVVLVCATFLPSCQSVDDSPSDDLQWGEPVLLDDGPGTAQRPQIAMDPMNAAIVVWDQTDKDSLLPPDDSGDIWVSRRDLASDWSRPEIIEQAEPLDGARPELGADANGNILVVYLQLQEEGFFRVWSVRYLVGDGWQAPECIQSASDDESCTEPINAGDAWKAQVAVAPDGGAVAIWQQTDLSNPDLGVREVVWSNRFSPSGGWVGARMVAPNELNSLFAPAVTIDAAGNAIAVWEQLDGTRSNIRSRRQADSGEWIDEQPVELAQENAFAPRVVSDDAGNAIAVWQQQTSSGSPEIWANRLLPSTGSWESAELIGPTEEGDAGAPRIAIDANGNVVAVWAQNGGPSAGVWSNRYDAGAGWRAPALISPRGLGPGRSPDVAISPSGRAVVVWVQFDGNTDRVWSNRSTTGGAWGRSESVPAPDEETRASGPHVAVDSMGRATAVWLSRSGVESAADLYSSRLE